MQIVSSGCSTDGAATPAADQLSLLDFPQLPLALIWQYMCKLPMCDRCALLATCKAALGTFGEITGRMERLQLTLLGESALQPWQEGVATEPLTDHYLVRQQLSERMAPSEDAQKQPQLGSTGRAAKVLSWFPNAEIGKLVMHCAGKDTWRALQSLTAAAARRLKHVTALELKGPKSPEVRKYHVVRLSSRQGA